VHEAGGWVRKRPSGHPSLTVRISVDRTAYDGRIRETGQGHEHSRQVEALALPDTGAQLCLAGVSHATALGVARDQLVKLETPVTAANGSPLTILGGIFTVFSAVCSDGSVVTSHQLLYIAEEAKVVFLSKEACQGLGVVSENFPEPGAAFKEPDLQVKAVSNSVKKQKCEAQNSELGEDSPCSCPRRQQAPAPPTQLPFPATPENRERLEQWILDYYGSSAFNQCQRQKLPMMKTSNPLKLHVDPEEPPYAVHKARPVPIHWRSKVKQDIDSDVRMGILDKTPVGEPTTWCAPMVVAAKANGDPGRTVDFQKLNKACVRKTHHMKPPYHLVSSVPKKVNKTTVDA
jgi:hypothetical protein